MADNYTIVTRRLGFRFWQTEDILQFNKMNSDPEVMRFFPAVLSQKESSDFLIRIKQHFENFGYGLFAAVEIASGDLIGFIGFQNTTFKSWFTPCVEIGWRFRKNYWNKGYATEGAKACLKYGFEVLNFKEVFSFTSSINLPSIKVMEKIGLKYRNNFGHPRLEPENELYTHVLYSLKKNEYKKSISG